MELSKIVIQLSLDDTPIKEFKSVKEASLQFGGKWSDRRRIHNCCNINRKIDQTFKGFKWKYKE